MEPLTFQSVSNNAVIYLGHYNVPEFSANRFMIAGQNTPLKLLTDESVADHKEPDWTSDNQEEHENAHSIDVQKNLLDDIIPELPSTIQDISSYKFVVVMAQQSFKHVKWWINQQENKGLKLTLIILIGCIIAMFWYLQMQVREFQQLSQNGSRTSQTSSVGRFGPITAAAEELTDGTVRIGKITFYPDQLLGKGCEGTFVYRGEFDKRQVAVKRLLPECFTFADREVALLRESDAHPNVIRYFCTEQDRMFRYIALELCQATLHDYVQGKFDTTIITTLDILRQATSGLGHLHSLDIVHRDIKPHNVLLSMPNSAGEIRAMISDFGLCKKLQVGRVSFSRRSGVTGTDGWIAPEMLNGNERTTCAVDMFSLGCLFYYVLSGGQHPFGDTLRRQANIIGNVYDLSELTGPPWQTALAKPLLAALISPRQNDRPLCGAVLMHPIFWSRGKILAFFQDVSDRIEKAELEDPVLKSLEKSCDFVVRGDWRQHIHEEVTQDLRKYRSYRGESVRDLLRALRNKKHHYRELTGFARELLGSIPDGFTSYWTSHFPLLLVHTWLTMQIVATEPVFRNYYHYCHRYALPNYRDRDDPLYSICNSDANAFDSVNAETILSTDEKYIKYPRKVLKPATFEQNIRPVKSKYMRTFVPAPEVGESPTDTNHNYTHERLISLGIARGVNSNVGLYRNTGAKVGENLPIKTDNVAQNKPDTAPDNPWVKSTPNGNIPFPVELNKPFNKNVKPINPWMKNVVVQEAEALADDTNTILTKPEVPTNPWIRKAVTCKTEEKIPSTDEAFTNVNKSEPPLTNPWIRKSAIRDENNQPQISSNNIVETEGVPTSNEFVVQRRYNKKKASKKQEEPLKWLLEN